MKECYFQALTCNFTKSNTPPWFFFTFLKLYKLYRIAKRITYGQKWSNTLNQFVMSVFDHFVKLALKGLKASLDRSGEQIERLTNAIIKETPSEWN